MNRLILNGKKAHLDEVRNAIYQVRDSGIDLQVRTTWESGDVARMVKEAIEQGVSRIIAGGGDGTINEVVDAVCNLAEQDRPEIGLLPLGTANDFATGNGVPEGLVDALRLAVTGDAVSIDAMRMNDRHFVNMATAGFGAKVTAETPVELKNFLGGGAYVLSGLLQALSFVPYHGHIETEHGILDGEVVVGAIGNGRQAGGGQQLAPHALIDDGKMDAVMILHFPGHKLSQVMQEVLDDQVDGEFVRRLRTSWMNCKAEDEMPVNLDGEPVSFDGAVRVETMPGALKMVLPKDSPQLSKNNP